MLKFCNHYHSDIWVCIVWYHPNCPDGGDWQKKGWWHLTPGQCKIVYGGDLDDVNRFWYFHAHAADGAFWAGDPVVTVPPQPFDWCINTSSTGSRNVGLRELDVGDNEDVTVNLTPLA